MWNKKMLYKLLTFFALVISIIFNFNVNVNAFSFQEIFDKAKFFELIGLPEANNILSQQTLEEIFIPIGQVLVTIAGIVLVLVTLVMAIKYLTANAEQRGKLKQQLVGLVVSTVVIYGAVGIWSIIKNFMENI